MNPNTQELMFLKHPQVVFATNTFINVPIILQYEDEPLISIVKTDTIGFTTRVPVYHEDRTYLGEIRGNRVYPTPDGKKAGLVVRQKPGVWVSEMAGKVLFEIRQGKGDSFRMDAELHTPDGYFLKSQTGSAPPLTLADDGMLQVGGMVMGHNIFSGCRVGVHMRKDGSVAVGTF